MMLSIAIKVADVNGKVYGKYRAWFVNRIISHVYIHSIVILSVYGYMLQKFLRKMHQVY